MAEEFFSKTTIFNPQEADRILSRGVVISMGDDLKRFAAKPGLKIAPDRDELKKKAEMPRGKELIGLIQKKALEDKKRERQEVQKRKQEEEKRKTSGVKESEAEERRRRQRDFLRQAQEKLRRETESAKRIVEETRKQAEAVKKEEAEGLGQEEEKKEQELIKSEKEKERIEMAQEAMLVKEIHRSAQEFEDKKLEEEKRLMEEIREKAKEAEQIKKEEVEKRRLEELRKRQEDEQKRREEEQGKQEEEKQKKEEELRKKEEQTKQMSGIEQIEEYKNKLEASKVELETKINNFPVVLKPLENKSISLQKQKDVVLKDISALVGRESELAAKKKALEDKEARAQESVERHRFEKNRWAQEEEIRNVEHEKWQKTEMLEAKNIQLKQVEEEIISVFQEKARVEQKLKEVIWKLKEIELKAEREKAAKDLAQLENTIRVIKQEDVALEDSYSKLSQELQAILKQEKEIESRIKQIEQQESSAPTQKQERQIEEQRWQVEQRRKKIEQQRWFLELKQKDLDKRIRAQRFRIEEFVSRKGRIESRIKEIDKVLAQAVEILQEKPKVQEKIAIVKPPEKPEEIKIKEPPKIEAKPLAEPAPVFKPEIKPEIKKQEPEKIKTADIIEQAKRFKEKEDEVRQIAEIRRKARQQEIQEKLRLIQAKGEKAKSEMEKLVAQGPIAKEIILRKLTKLSPEEEAEREKFLARIAVREKQKFNIKDKEAVQEIVFRPVVRKPSTFEKIIARLLIVLLIAGVLLLAVIIWQAIKSGGNLPFSFGKFLHQNFD